MRYFLSNKKSIDLTPRGSRSGDGPKILVTSVFVRLISVFALLIVLLAPMAHARGRARKKRTPAPTPHAIVISRIGTNSITVTDENTTKTVTVTQFTEIIVNGRRATFADLKPGMEVSLGLSSPTVASRVTATDAPAAGGSKK
jgi:hypothetical protein